jgi:hypothetical protein
MKSVKKHSKSKCAESMVVDSIIHRVVILSGKTLLALVFLILSSMAHSQLLPGPKANAQGDLSLLIVASDSPAYIKEWLSTSPEHGVSIKRLKIAKPNQLIVTAFLVTGLTPDSSGSYKYSVNVYVINPSNKPMWGQKSYAGGQGVLPNKPMIMMADPALDLILEESDPSGEYSIVAEVTDLVSGKKADHSYQIMFNK